MRWRLKSPASRLFAQPFVQAQIKENITALRHWPLWGETIGDRWIPLTKGQWRRKCFHLMTSSWAFILLRFYVTLFSSRYCCLYFWLLYICLCMHLIVYTSMFACIFYMWYMFSFYVRWFYDVVTNVCLVRDELINKLSNSFWPGDAALPDSKVHGANMGPTWVLSTPDGPHVGPMNLAITWRHTQGSDLYQVCNHIWRLFLLTLTGIVTVPCTSLRLITICIL